MGLYSLDNYYDLSTWYENIGAYDLWTGTDLMLDLSRQILSSGAYMFQGIAFPKGADVMIPQGATFNGSINLIPYSYILTVTGFSANGNQMTVRIFDKGAQTDVYEKQFAWFPTVISNMEGSFNEGEDIVLTDRDKPFGPYFFRDPLIVLPPGVLQIQVTNVDMNPAVLPSPTAAPPIFQILFGIAVPKNTVSVQNQVVLTSTDQTGTQTLQGAGSAASVVNFMGS
jgi:hypothetical protein